MKYYKSNTNEFIAAENILDALAAIKHKHPKKELFLFPIKESEIPIDAELIYTGII